MIKSKTTFGYAAFAVLALSLTQVNSKSVSRNAPLDLIILHNNDMHARFEQTSANSDTCSKEDVTNNKCYGGFARVGYELKKFRNEADNGGAPVLYLNAGDTYTGTPWFSLYKDKIVSAFLNLLRPDAISLGNHEFDNGVDGLVPFLNAAHFPVLAANLDLSKTPEMQNTTSLKKSTVFDVNGVKVGVIGYLTPETKLLVAPNTVEYFDEIQAINSEAEALRQTGVNIIIALGHSGYEKDKEIGIECPLVDVVIGGHSHSFLYTGDHPEPESAIGPYPTTVKKPNGVEVPVVQAYAYTKYLGHLRLSFDANGNLLSFNGTPILLSGEVPRDQDVLALLETYRPGLDELYAEVVGETKVTLDGVCRFGECNFGNLIADSMVYVRSIQHNNSDGYWTDAAISFMNSGGIRANVARGIITHYDLMTVLPFDSRIVVVQMTGKDILTTLENTVRRYSDTIGRGEFFQYSGLQVTFNLTQPTGSRVQSVRVRCANCDVPRFDNLDDSRTYNVVTTDFIGGGGDGHTTFLNKPTISTGIVDLDAVISYIKSVNVVYPAVEWRTTLIGKVQEEDDDDDTEPNNARHVNTSFMLIGSILLSTFYRYL
ncbi:protein 5NUC-like isoform X2 [Bradysia coprophila]|uniref:protein 5NUC-like isoform X2 n=1 Tax=Bradysia coprophila TaxID=38358 RepID=UPI00187DBA5D|nr:protein 5NUC-like isoform X2 [Bradysia coprophila]